MKHLSIKTTTLCFLLITASFAFYSCRKTGPAEALITVTDSTGQGIPGATVVLKQDSVISPTTGAQANVKQSQVTDYLGQTKFTFALEAVLNVEVTKGALFVRDYIRLEQSKEVDKTIILK